MVLEPRMKFNKTVFILISVGKKLGSACKFCMRMIITSELWNLDRSKDVGLFPENYHYSSIVLLKQRV